MRRFLVTGIIVLVGACGTRQPGPPPVPPYTSFPDTTEVPHVECFVHGYWVGMEPKDIPPKTQCRSVP